MDETLSALAFLRHHFRYSEGWIEFRLIGGGKTSQHFFRLETLEQDWPQIEPRLRAANAAGANIYFGVAPRIEQIGDAAHCGLFTCLMVDIDYKGPTVKTNVEVLKANNLEPHVVIDSGRGWHFYWYLREPTLHAEVEPVLKNLIRVLAADPVIHDAPRIMRVPGFLNVKYDHRPPCKVVKYNLVGEISLLDFDALRDAASGEYPDGKGVRVAVPSRLPVPAPVGVSKLTIEAYGNGHGFAHMMSDMIAGYWKGGNRHRFALAVAGLLRREDVNEEGAALIIHKICELTKDEETGDRLKAVQTTYAAQLDSIVSTGAIKEILGEEESRTFLKRFNAILGTIPPPPAIRHKLPEFELYKCIPSGTHIDRYLAYADSKTDAPLQYHLASILTVTAAAMGNRVYIPNIFGTPKLFPTLYTMVVGPSSRFRKSTAINIARRVADAAGVDAFPNNATTERLFEAMAPNEDEVEMVPGPRGTPVRKVVSWRGRPEGCIYYPEFATFLSATTSRSYQSNLRDFYMDLYDGTMGRGCGGRETKTQGRYIVEDPAISMLAGVTPASLREFCSGVDMRSGFLPRFLIIMYPPAHRNRIGLPLKVSDDVDAISDVATFLRELKSLSDMEVSITVDAVAAYEVFQAEIYERIHKIEGTPLAVLDGFLNRLLTMVLKIGMVYAASRRSWGLVDVEDMTPAINLCRWSARSMSHFLEDVQPEEDRGLVYYHKLMTSARGLLKRGESNPITHAALLKNAHLGAREFADALETAIQQGSIQPVRRGRGVSYLIREVEVESE